MTKKIGILSTNKNFIKNVSENLPTGEIAEYSSIEKINIHEIIILIVDIHTFASFENIQFFLSKIRKKLLKIPVLLAIPEGIEKNISEDWFFTDFIIYPFRGSELEQRIKIALRRVNITNDENILMVGNIVINTREYSVFLNDEKIDCTFKEFELLRYLVENKGIVLSRKELLNKIWGIDYIGGTRTVDVHIRRLRSKLGEEFSSVIETVRNVGYRCKQD